jgi:hypothetical protein
MIDNPPRQKPRSDLVGKDAMSDDDWAASQLQPMNMFELAKSWTTAVKVLGAANGAGLAAAGAALSTFEKHPDVLLWVKLGGFFFFAGVFTFAIAFLSIHIAVFQFDEMLHATRRKDLEAIRVASRNSSAAMIGANNLVIASTIAFFLGLVAGLVVFIRY